MAAAQNILNICDSSLRSLKICLCFLYLVQLVLVLVMLYIPLISVASPQEATCSLLTAVKLYIALFLDRFLLLDILKYHLRDAISLVCNLHFHELIEVLKVQELRRVIIQTFSWNLWTAHTTFLLDGICCELARGLRSGDEYCTFWAVWYLLNCLNHLRLSPLFLAILSSGLTCTTSANITCYSH